MSKNHKIVNLMVFYLAVTSFAYCHRQNFQKIESHPQEQAQRPKEFDWDKTTMVDAFQAGKIKTIEDFVNQAPHINETIIVNKNNYKKRRCAGAYQPKDDKVHLKYFIPDLTDCTPEQAESVLKKVNKWNCEVLKMTDKAHEFHHRYIRKKGVFFLKNSAEDYARICAHNEISAFTNMFLYQRELVKREIMNDVPAEIWRKTVSSRFKEYWDAVEKGEVRLDNLLLNDEQKDNLLISTTVFNWWMKNEYDKNVYVSSQRTKSYLSLNKWAVNYPCNAKNYEKALDICYTFIKDGKLVNLNRYFKNGMSISYGIGSFPFGTQYEDIDNQPEVKMLIEEIRNTSKNKFDNKTATKMVNKVIQNTGGR